MLTQTSVKKSLAYSTIAQMGFMMLQCGLGAFSAAMLHILAHSLYKAHAFLSSGNVITERAAITRWCPAGSPVGWSKIVAAAAVVRICLGISFMIFRNQPADQARRTVAGRNTVFGIDLLGWASHAKRQSQAAGSGNDWRGRVVSGVLRQLRRRRPDCCDESSRQYCTGRGLVCRVARVGWFWWHVLAAGDLAQWSWDGQVQQVAHSRKQRILLESTLRRVFGSLAQREERESASKAMPTA